MNKERFAISLIYKITIVLLLLSLGFLAGYYYKQSITQNDSDNLSTNLEVENNDLEPVPNDNTIEDVRSVTRTYDIYNLFDNEIIETFTITHPENISVSKGSTGYTSTVVLSLGDDSITFGIPHGSVAFAYGFENPVEISNDTVKALYRVNSRSEPKTVTYMIDPTLSGTCDTNIPENPTIKAPCGLGVVEDLVISCQSDSNDYTFCDSIMEKFQGEQ